MSTYTTIFFVPRDLNMGRQGGHTHGPIKFAPNKQLFDMIRSKFFQNFGIILRFFFGPAILMTSPWTLATTPEVANMKIIKEESNTNRTRPSATFPHINRMGI